MYQSMQASGTQTLENAAGWNRQSSAGNNNWRLATITCAPLRVSTFHCLCTLAAWGMQIAPQTGTSRSGSRHALCNVDGGKQRANFGIFEFFCFFVFGDWSAPLCRGAAHRKQVAMLTGNCVCILAIVEAWGFIFFSCFCRMGTCACRWARNGGRTHWQQQQ